ncbi:hypothetical protein, partial [Staphylococcus argenteus]
TNLNTQIFIIYIGSVILLEAVKITQSYFKIHFPTMVLAINIFYVFKTFSQQLKSNKKTSEYNTYTH